MFSGLPAELASAWDQPIGDTSGRKKRNQATSHLSCPSKEASPMANLPIKWFFFLKLLFYGSNLFITIHDVMDRDLFL